MPVKVYERILDLFEAEGIDTIFGIPDPNFVHLFHLADERGWSVVAPHHEASAGFMAEAVSRMTGRPAVCVGTLGPGLANLAPAMMCALVENSPVVFLGGQRARITEQRVRRGRIQFVRQEPLLEASVKYSASIEYADQTDEVVREGLRRALSGTPGPVYIEYPSHVIQAELDVPEALPPAAYRLVGQQAGPDAVAGAAEAIADHLLAGGPDPARALASQRPGFGFKRLLRRALDLEPPNRLLDAALATPLLPALARQVFFGRGSKARLLRRSESGHRFRFS